MNEETKQALLQKYYALREKYMKNHDKINDLNNENEDLLRQMNLFKEENIMFLGKTRHG